jgi:hypothetical protein
MGRNTHLWDPRVVLAVGGDTLSTVYTAMWQVQATIAAVALPILLFVIQLSTDQRQAATRSHEVLIRHTWILPILVYSLMGTIRIGVDILWYPRPVVFLVDFVLILIPTILLALSACVSTLHLLFSPVKMKAHALQVVRENITQSLDASIGLRLANNLLFGTLKPLNVGFWPFSLDRSEANQYAILRASREGVLADINVQGLQGFIRKLPRRRRVPTGSVSQVDPMEGRPEERPGKDDKQHIWLMKKYGERITKVNEGLMRIELAQFEQLDLADLEAQLALLIKVESLQ